MAGARTPGIATTTSRSGSVVRRGGDRLKREDHLYDFIIEIDHNTRPRIAGRGSAVFLHLARDNFGPTAGCVSMRKAAMLQLLRRLGPRTKIIIG
ncbi:L,D-peptidoglycan transpeptidase YkuD (ErfK/YbiS/YcfS/YnhG family) [Bradyrhizobium sp. LM2.7]